MNGYAVGASFLGTGVEFVEALTIVLAVGSVRGWRSALSGAFAAVVILAALIAVIGAPVANVMNLSWVQGLVGVILLLFGIRWLRKAILRYSGLKALHDEAESYRKEMDRQKQAGALSKGLDRMAFSTAFSGTFLEGLEAVFIVLTFGASAHAMPSAMLGAGLATVAVVVLGLALRKPLTSIPENTMKYIVGLMLTSFGVFWTGEGIGVAWPQADVSIVYLAAAFVVLSYGLVKYCRRGLAGGE